METASSRSGKFVPESTVPEGSQSGSVATAWQPWVPIVARVTAAVFGGYALTWAFGVAASKLLPMRPSEAVFLISILQICVYTGVVIWTFSVTGKRAWITLLALSALCMSVTLIG